LLSLLIAGFVIFELVSQLLHITGFVTFEQFSKLVTSKIECNESKEEVKRAFRLFDEDNTGKITFAKLKKIAKELGEDISDEDLKVNFYFVFKTRKSNANFLSKKNNQM